MSGTSMDAIDVVLADIGEQSISVLAYQQFPIPDKTRRRVRAINRRSSISTVTKMHVTVGELFAEAICSLIDSTNLKYDDIVAIGSHGQTVLHLPEEKPSRTLQIGDGNTIAFKTGITTVTDFRGMDLAANGQGAPLAPGFHAWYFASADVDRVILNIGGIANLTVLKGEETTGFDSGPGNALLDDWIRLHKNLDFDRDGEWAASGQCDETLLNAMLNSEYINKKPPKSTGRDEFNLNWLNELLNQGREKPSAANVQATLLQFTAMTICDAINQYARTAQEVLVCGGGCHNLALMEKLTFLLKGKSISSTAKYDLDPDAVEALAFAWLAKQRLDCEPGNLPAVTGAHRPVILGAVYEVSGK